MASNERYAELADKIVDLLGGKGNISGFTHCFTRLRFNVLKKNLVKLDEINELPGVLGAQLSGEQLQVIIGQAVSDAYQLIAEKHDLDTQGAVDENPDDAPKKRFGVATILDAISGSIVPLIPMMIGGGFIKIIVLLGEQFGWFAAGDATHTVLTFVGDSTFYFFPVFLGAMAARKFKANMSLGMFIGALLIHPTFVQSVADGMQLNLFGMPVYATTYTYSVLPVILAVAVMAPVERFFARISPDVIRAISEPFLTLVVMVPLTLCVIAPLGAFLGNYIYIAIMWLYNTFGFIAVGIMGALWPWLVMTGMHGAFNPFLIESLARTGSEPIIFTAAIISCIDQGVAALAVALKAKDVDTRSTATATGVAAVISGIIEPVMYGVNMRLRTPMFTATAGSLVGALVAGFGGAVAHAQSGSTGLIGGLPIYLGGDIANLLWMLAGTAVGAIATFIFTMVFYKPEEAK